MAIGATATAAPGPKAWVVRATLPLVAIDTEGRIVNEPKVSARMRVIDRGAGRVNRLGMRATGYDGAIGIEIRGSSSLGYPKKQYSIETRTAGGKNRSVRLLGLPKENDWVLQGPYGDKTLLRNSVATERRGASAPTRAARASSR